MEPAMHVVARWSIAHRGLVVVLWLLLLGGSIASARLIGNHFVNSLALPGTGAQRAADLLHSRFPTAAGDSDQIVFQAPHDAISDPGLKARVTATLAAVTRLPHVTQVSAPYATAG